MKPFLPFLVTLLLVSINACTAARDQTTRDVLTYHNDGYRTGVYASETSLRPTTVTAGRFGEVFARKVHGQIWGQPLYVRGVLVNGQLRNVVYVATSENWVYAFDADDWTPGEDWPPLRSRQLGDIPDRIGEQVFYTIYPSNGISSTPVIDLGNPPDPGNGTFYVVAKFDKDKKFRVFALDLGTLADRRDPVIVDGKASGVSFESDKERDHLNRPALLITNHQLIIAFGAGAQGDNQRDDGGDYHGWVMSYSLPDLRQTGVFVTTPTLGMGGIWQSGAGLAADDGGNVYFMTGNGHFEDKDRPRPDLADAFVRLSTNDGLQLRDWYAPRSREVLEACDLDLGASGPAVIQEFGKVLGSGKSGILYVLDKEHMGGTESPYSKADRENWRGFPDCTIPTAECFRVAENEYALSRSKVACSMKGYGDNGNPEGYNDDEQWKRVVMSYGHVHGSPVLWKFGRRSYNLYVWPEQDFLKAYHHDGQKFDQNPVGSSAPMAGAMMSMPGGLLSLSWDGNDVRTGIIWTARPNPQLFKIVAGPFIDTFTGHDQQHFAFRTADGGIWDTFYCPKCDHPTGWRVQQINCGKYSSCVPNNPIAMTNGPSAVDGPFITTYNDISSVHDQQHFAYTAADGGIWDAYYCGGCSDPKWRLQQINDTGHGGLTNGPAAAAAAPFVDVFAGHDQQHFAYRTADGSIWDAFYCHGCSDPKWRLQQINCGPTSPCANKNPKALTNGPTAVHGPFIDTYAEHDQQHFAYTAADGGIWDAFYCGGCSDPKWRLQQINDTGHGGLTNGPAAAAAPFVDVFAGHDQQHFAYRTADGSIWDAFYCDGCSDSKWRLQQINCGPTSLCANKNPKAVTNGPTAADGPFINTYNDTFSVHDQQHFAYQATDGGIWDAFYCGGCSDPQWLLQQINDTHGPAAAAAPFLNVFLGHDQQHFAYRTVDGSAWDAFYCDRCSDPKWRLQQLESKTGCLLASNDLTPDAAPCNAINKIVHGYLQAFVALPGRTQQLTELWNSDNSPNDQVRWFAKNSPPTIADGKVFVAEFPDPDLSSGLSSANWSTTGAFGRLIVYSLSRSK